MEELAFVRQAELAFVRHPRDSLAFADDEVPEQLATIVARVLQLWPTEKRRPSVREVQ